jgi:hypothetical protein
MFVFPKIEPRCPGEELERLINARMRADQPLDARPYSWNMHEPSTSRAASPPMRRSRTCIGSLVRAQH